MWSDNESNVDLLRFSYLSSSVKEIISNSSLTPTTIGLFGDWGSGKSTLMRLIEKNLSQDSKIAIVSFNGWLFEGYEDAKSSLMGAIIHALAEKKGLYDKCGDKVKDLLRKVDWFHAISTLGKYAVPALLGQPHISLAFAGSDGIKALKKIWSRSENVFLCRPESSSNFRSPYFLVQFGETKGTTDNQTDKYFKSETGSKNMLKTQNKIK